MTRSLPPEWDGAGATLDLVAFYDHVRVPAADVPGEVDGRWTVVTSHLVRERMVMAARAVGAAKRVLDAIARYLADIAIGHYLAHSALYRLALDETPSRADASEVMRDIIARDLLKPWRAGRSR